MPPQDRQPVAPLGQASAPSEEQRRDALGGWLRRGLVALVLGGLGVAYVATVPRAWHPTPDGACYLIIGRSLARGEGYTFAGAPVGKRPPVFPLIVAAGHAASGGDVRGVRQVVAALGVAALAAAYALVRAREGTGAALAVVLLTATCSWFWWYAAGWVLAEVPYAFFSLAALWFAERELRSQAFSLARWLVVALMVVVATYTHMVGSALTPALVCGALFAPRPRRPMRRRLLAALLVGAVGSAATLGWLARGQMLRRTRRASSYTTLVRAASRRTIAYPAARLKRRVREWTATPLSLEWDEVAWPAGAGALALLVAPGLAWGFRRHRSCAEFYLCTHFLIATFVGGGHGHERYVVPVVPLLLYYGYLSLRVLGAGAARLLGLQGGQKEPALGCLARVLLTAVLLAILCAAIYYRVRGKHGAVHFSRPRQAETRARRASWEEAARWVERRLPPHAVLWSNTTVATYYTERRAQVNAFLVRPRGILKHMSRCGADYVLADSTRMAHGLGDTLEAAPQAFVLLEQNDHCRLYRVDREALERALERSKARRRRPQARRPASPSNTT
ncbi:MAG: glycosyltransferase family 39 protein [Candidatus Brocadiia bacterium]